MEDTYKENLILFLLSIYFDLRYMILMHLLPVFINVDNIHVLILSLYLRSHYLIYRHLLHIIIYADFVISPFNSKMYPINLLIHHLKLFQVSWRYI
jgi:hypothetical protein